MASEALRLGVRGVPEDLLAGDMVPKGTWDGPGRSIPGVVVGTAGAGGPMCIGICRLGNGLRLFKVKTMVLEVLSL